MLKTPLPEKLEWQYNVKGGVLTEAVATIEMIRKQQNQLITYLAELTEVVEGKANYACEGKHYDNEPCELCYPIYRGSYGTSGTNQQTPSLKEQLLDEVYRLHEIYGVEDIPHINKEEVKAIINRLIP